MDSNHDLLAERAGICVKFPGKNKNSQTDVFFS